MLLQQARSTGGNQGTAWRLDVRRVLHLGTRTLCGLVVLVVLCTPIGFAQGTQHSITIAIPSYTQGTDPTTGFNFYQSTTTGGPYIKMNAFPVLLGSGNPVASVTFTAGVGGTKYFFVATAVDATGNESGVSNEVSATFLENPAAPGGITAVAK